MLKSTLRVFRIHNGSNNGETDKSHSATTMNFENIVLLKNKISAIKFLRIFAFNALKIRSLDARLLLSWKPKI